MPGCSENNQTVEHLHRIPGGGLRLEIGKFQIRVEHRRVPANATDVLCWTLLALILTLPAAFFLGIAYRIFISAAGLE